MKKILYVASSSAHLKSFHMPYIDSLKQNFELKIMAKKTNDMFVDFDINFKKKTLSFSHIKIIKQIKTILEKENFDVVVLNTTLASFLVRCAIKHIKTKPIVINIVHGYFFSHKTSFIKRLFFKLAEKYVKKQTEHVIVMNDEDYDLALKNKLYDKSLHKINGMGFNDQRFDEFKPYEYKKTDEPEFLFIGEISKRKNQKFLLRFIKELKKYAINAHLTLVGEGDYLEKINKWAKKLKIEEQVKIVGFDSDIQKHLRETDYYICASYIEGLPFNILEAMYSGCIILSSDIKGSEDLIKDYETGILYKLNDIDDLTTKFRLLQNDISLKKKLSVNANNQSKKYLLKNVFDQNINIIEGLILDNGKR